MSLCLCAGVCVFVNVCVCVCVCVCDGEGGKQCVRMWVCRLIMFVLNRSCVRACMCVFFLALLFLCAEVCLGGISIYALVWKLEHIPMLFVVLGYFCQRERTDLRVWPNILA